jgi:conjugative relaxase-like TrwC/TraI family protein
MVASVSPIPGSGTYYSAKATEQYLNRPGHEPPGEYWGEGSARIGLTGTVGPEFARVHQGFGRDGTPLLQNAGKRNQTGTDVTLSFEKTAGVAWGVADPPERKAIEECGKRAVHSTLQLLQDESLTRRGKGGYVQEKALPVVTVWPHGTSRANDPQPHWHCLFHFGVREDGTCGGLVSKKLYQAKMMAGAAFRCQLTYELHTALGMVCEREGSFFRLKGVPEALRQRFSTRGREIREATSSVQTNVAKAKSKAVLQTRKGTAKKPQPTRADLHAKWQAVAREYGFGPEQVRRLCHKAPVSDPAIELYGAYERAIKRLSETQAAWTKTNLLRFAFEEATGRGVSVGQVKQFVTHSLATDKKLVHLGRFQGVQHFTARENWHLEERLRDLVAAGRSDKSHVLSPKAVQSAIGKSAGIVSTFRFDRVALDASQERAVRSITRRQGAVAFLSGIEGAGREKVLRVAAAAWKRKGYTVIAAGKSMKQLAKANIPTHTVGKLIYDENRGLGSRLFHDARQLLRAARGKSTWKYGPVKLDKKTVVLVTDANMPLKQLVELTEKCRAAGAKLVLTADPHVPTGRLGVAFHDLAAKYQAPTLTGALPKKKDPADTQALKSLLAGDTQAALQSYAERGRLRVSDTAADARKEVLSTWSKHGLRNPKKHLMIAPSKETATLNKLAQQERRRSKPLLGFRIRITRKSLFIGTPRIKGKQEYFYQGDRVQLTSGSSYYGTQPGELATIRRIDPVKKTVTLKLDRKFGTVTISYKKFVPLTLAYALTARQASTLQPQNAYVLWSGELQNQDATAFLASKAKNQTRFFTTKEDAGERLTDLARLAQRPNPKELAHTVKERNLEEEQEITRDL